MAWRLSTLLLSVVLFSELFISGQFIFPLPTISYGTVELKAQKTDTVPDAAPTSFQESLMTKTTSPTEEYGGVFYIGDVLLARYVEELSTHHGPEYPFEQFSPQQLQDNPAVFINFESSIPEVHTPTPSFQVRFSTPIWMLVGLQEFGVTHASLANNHSLDFGTDAYNHTVTQLDNFGVSAVGHPDIVTLEHVSYTKVEDLTVATIAASALTNSNVALEIESILPVVEQNSDLQFVFIHWGDEYIETSNNAQRTLAKDLVSLGIDAVIGHHPHVIQEIEMIDGAPIFYSLGNYVFDQYFSESVQTGLVLHFVWSDVPGFYLLPVSSLQTLSQPKLIPPSEHAAFLQKISEKSNGATATYIKNGFIPIQRVATSIKTAMID